MEALVSAAVLSVRHIRKTSQTLPTALVVKLLLAAGLDVNAEDKGGRTSLHRAVRRQIGSMIWFLLQNGWTDPQ